MQGLLILRALLVVFLYAFLALALYVIWREFTHNTGKVENNPDPALLRITHASMESTEFQLRPVTALGRNNDNHIVIDDPFASTHHAIIVWRDQQWWVEDLESHNGTQLNDNLLTEPHVLTSGDIIRIGESTFVFVMQSI
ncbi:MAG: FHA domain-containing protein [Anaerolineales bacterium]|nr:MAG: FHA domain-containing protein [Anaerolineales bacterium]